MNIGNKYTEYIVSTTQRLVAIPSPSGYTHNAADFIADELRGFGFAPSITNRGNVLCKLGGNGNGIILAAHFDTLGGIVRTVKSNGRLRIERIGGLAMGSYEAENVTVITRSGATFSGTFQMNEPSVHVAGGDYSSAKRETSAMEVVLDEKVSSADDTKKLGIDTGDIVAFDPRFVVTGSGYVKSRFLDDKAGSAILLSYARLVAEENLPLSREVWLMFTCHEEVGTGAASGLPDGCTEILSVDMGCVGDDLDCTETEVSICVKDGGGPYDYRMISDMKNICLRDKIAHALDVYPYYGSDADAAVSAGYHLRHGCIGPGIYASHGYERGHRDGFTATLQLVAGYVAG